MDLTQITVSEFLAANPTAAAVLEKLRIDYCCGGGRSMADACDQARVTPAALLQALGTIVEKPTASACLEKWKDRPLRDLVPHIVDHYHAKLLGEIPRLRGMTAKVATVHGQHRPQFLELARLFQVFADEAETHLDKEERILFPWILEGATKKIEAPIAAMRSEHNRHLRHLEQMRKLCDDYVAPDYACNTWRALYANLKALDQELREHIDMENNVVFPRALACAG